MIYAGATKAAVWNMMPLSVRATAVERECSVCKAACLFHGPTLEAATLSAGDVNQTLELVCYKCVDGVIAASELPVTPIISVDINVNEAYRKQQIESN